MSDLNARIQELKKELDVVLVAHFYQKDDVFAVADITGDSLELARKVTETSQNNVVFCGVGFMGQSVKILAPNKRVMMPKIACCAMAKMVDEYGFDASIDIMESQGIAKEDILPVTYINSSAEVKARVGKMGGIVCTSSNAKTIMTEAIKSGKKIFFLPDQCLGQNLAKMIGLSSVVIHKEADLKNYDVLCYDGFCSVHQLFEVSDIEFFRHKYPDIQIVVHPECKPDVVEQADFVGSTSQIIKYIAEIPKEQKVAVGTEFNLVNRLREENTYILSSTRPTCPTMNETTLQDVHDTLLSIKEGKPMNEIFVDDETIHYANEALERMLKLSK